LPEYLKFYHYLVRSKSAEWFNFSHSGSLWKSRPRVHKEFA